MSERSNNIKSINKPKIEKLDSNILSDRQQDNDMKEDVSVNTGYSKYSSLTTTAELDVYDIPFFVSWWVFSTDLILFERSLIDHTGMSQLREGFSVDSSSSKHDKSSNTRFILLTG
jgi:hypothetical protein